MFRPTVPEPERRGVIPTIPIWVCTAQRGRDFRTHDLERGIHFPDVF